jgi:hypothetical protein
MGNMIKQIILNRLKELTKETQILVKELCNGINKLKDEDIEKIISGNAYIELKVITKDSKINKIPKIFDEIKQKLEGLSSREDGLKFLKNNCKTKNDLIKLAKQIDIPVSSSYKVEQLRERIVEATIGYRIRSAAIQDSSD